MASQHDSMAHYAILNTFYETPGDFSVRAEVWPEGAFLSEFEKIAPVSN